MSFKKYISNKKSPIKSCRKKLQYQFGSRSLKGKKSNFEEGKKININASMCVGKVHILIGKITM